MGDEQNMFMKKIISRSRIFSGRKPVFQRYLKPSVITVLSKKSSIADNIFQDKINNVTKVESMYLSRNYNKNPCHLVAGLLGSCRDLDLLSR